MNMQCRKINIKEVCNVERAVAGKIYSAGSCYIKLSAADESVAQIPVKGKIESRYAVFEPREMINIEYLYITIEKSFPKFLRRYRTTINLQFDALKQFEIWWHDDKKTQEYIVESIKKVNTEINLIERQIADEKEIKKWYLRKMMV